MNILFIQWQNIIQLPNGASVYEHNFAQWLKGRGHHVKMCGQYSEAVCHEGIDYFPYKYKKTLIQWCDMVIARVGDARGLGKPTIWIQHNQTREPFDVSKGKVIYCAQHVAAMAYRCEDSTVLWPFNRYANSEPLGPNPYGCVTLVNCNANKGGGFLRRLAEQLPNVKFMGVTGGYGVQIRHNLPNIIYVKGSVDIRAVLANSSILIMPSEKEGLPTIALEAVALGIPVLMNAIPAAYEVGAWCATFDRFASKLSAMLVEYDKYRALTLELKENHAAIHTQQLHSLQRWGL